MPTTARKLMPPEDLAVTAEATEAACLLDSGVLYGRRLLLRGATGDPVFAGFKPGAFSVYFGDAPVMHFDREGRWQRAFVDGVHYLKALDTTVQAIDRVREGENMVLKRRTLDAPEATALDATVTSLAVDLIDALDSGRNEKVGPTGKGRPIDPADLRAFLEQIARWDAAAWADHRERHRAAYGRLPFLPPDCPNPVVLQATLGHRGGRAFGGAASEPLRVRTPAEFRTHAREVAALLGRRVEQGKAVFLAGPDVLRRPTEDIAAYLSTVAEVFPIDPAPGHRRPNAAEDAPHRLDGVHAFLDDVSPPLPDRDGWRRLRALGLVRVGLGVGSGDPAVRAALGTTWTNDAMREAVCALKAAGVGVGVSLLVGAGGHEGSGRHVEGTAELVNALELGPGDLVALLDAREMGGPGEPLTDPAWAAQRDALKAGLAPVRQTRGAKVVSYSLEKQGLS